MALIANKKIHLEFSILEKVIFGIELLGTEVKSLRKSQGSLDGAKVVLVSGELFLIGSYIPAFQENNVTNFDAYRSRRLLANKKEIHDVKDLRHGEKLQIFPIALFDKGGLIKLECGIGKRLKKQDKRQVIRDKDDKRKNML